MAEKQKLPDPPKTGWPPGMLQDDCKGLSQWLASKDCSPKVSVPACGAAMPDSMASNSLSLRADTNEAMAEIFLFSSTITFPKTPSHSVQKSSLPS